ncbi:bola protein [Diplogelasinospora grovesii]|uniref:Bola protein n=1 Tax=Diplogelasinospora grovesii TaxID=303347 RepID=A0AAN6N6T9_9PEZI|nr:bola protein [Diplogelasinospora grovesii]
MYTNSIQPFKPTAMICRACLRAGKGGVPAGATRSSSQRILRLQSISSIASRRAQPMATTRQLSRAALSCPVSQRTFSVSRASRSDSAPPPAIEKPDFLSEGESAVWDRLTAEFSPTELIVQDISGGCGSMYGIEISSEKFRGLNMLRQQRLVNAALGDLMKDWHGVQLKTRVP